MNKRKRVVLKNNFKRHRGTMMAQSEAGNEGKTEDMSYYIRVPPYERILFRFSPFVEHEHWNGCIEPSNNEYAWAQLLDIFTLGSYKKSPAKLRIVFIASVSGVGYNKLLMCITHWHYWRDCNYFTILIRSADQIPMNNICIYRHICIMYTNDRNILFRIKLIDLNIVSKLTQLDCLK